MAGCTDEWSPVFTTRDTLLADYRRTAELVTSFWRRWLQEYFTALREQHRTEHTTPRSHEKERPRQGVSVPVTIFCFIVGNGEWESHRVAGQFQKICGNRIPEQKDHHSSAQSRLQIESPTCLSTTQSTTLSSKYTAYNDHEIESTASQQRQPSVPKDSNHTRDITSSYTLP
ncbi:unnamed protein product [Haemonchus placei]|uniref:DUF5641 domain-containing protein n=1 Tax=Haemonchus placei TaxID=6290 RepID=A0A0N4WZM0_HAEPC|nr:unnamed protein product [Haemonchus placei]